MNCHEKQTTLTLNMTHEEQKPGATEGVPNGSVAPTDPSSSDPHDEVNSSSQISRPTPESVQTTECGLLRWRPSFLKPCAGLAGFTAIISLCQIFGGVNFSYYTSVLSQIEKQYGLPSSMSGIIKNCDNIGFMLTVLLFSHFCRNWNKPILFAVTNAVAALAVFLMMLPHFILTGSHRMDSESQIDEFNQTQMNFEFCSLERNVTDDATCQTELEQRFNPAALAIFICANLLQGMSRSPHATLSLTYMDDADRDSVPKYFGKEKIVQLD